MADELSQHATAIERMRYFADRILRGDDSTANGSHDLDYSHDELSAAAREYLGLGDRARLVELVKQELAARGHLGANEQSSTDRVAEVAVDVVMRRMGFWT